MFRVSTNIEQEITKKKKLIFVSTLSSNETSSFEPKNNENPKIISKSSSLRAPAPAPKKITIKKIVNNTNNNITNHKIMPKRILFHLYRVNFLNQKKDKVKSHYKKENNLNKNGFYNIKQKQKHIQSKNINIPYNNKNYSTGRWKSDEHQRFIDAIIKYGNNWRQVQKCVGTRSSTQTRSHAQKFFEKLKRSKIFQRENYDFSKNSLKILHDIMNNLPDKEYNQTLNALHSLSYERKSNFENGQNNNVFINFNNKIFNENKENNYENNNYDINTNNNININKEDNIKNIQFYNQGYCFLENNNNKLYNNNDYLCYNSNYNISSINNITDYNNNLIKDLNDDIKIDERKESNTFTQRKISLSEMNLNINDLKDLNNNVDDCNLLDYNLNNNICKNTFTQQDNKNKIFDIIEDKIDYKQQFTNIDFLFNSQTSRKMSFEEK